MWRVELKPDGVVRQAKGAWRVSLVYPGSPADRSGIRSGWQLLSIDGASITPRLLNRARRIGNVSLRFIDELGNAYIWKDRYFPFGIHVSQPLNQRFRRRIMNCRESDEDRATLIDLFAMGDLKAFEDLIIEFQAALGARQSWFARIGLREPTQSDEVPNSDNHEILDMLALGFVSAEKYPQAKVASDRADAAREKVGQRSYSTNILAINYFVKAHLAIASGELDRAIQLAQQAWSLHSDYFSLRNLVWTLTGEQPISTSRNQLGKRFPLDYNLLNDDPVGELPASGKYVDLNTFLKSMSDGQILIVIVYGPYRSNYYGNIDIERLALMYPAFRETIAGVHLICSSDYALSAEHRHEVEGFAQRQGLPLTVLWDEDDSLMNKLGRGGSPVRCVLDNSGTVLSTAPLAQEKGLWEALEFQRSHRGRH